MHCHPFLIKLTIQPNAAEHILALMHKRTIPLSYAGITQIRFKGTKAYRFISAMTAPLVDFLV